MNKRHYEHTLPNIRGSLSNTYTLPVGQDGRSRALSRSPSFRAIRGPPCSDCSCMIDAVLPDLSVSKHVVLYGFVNLRTAMMLWTFLSPLLSNFLLSLGWLTT